MAGDAKIAQNENPAGASLRAKGVHPLVRSCPDQEGDSAGVAGVSVCFSSVEGAGEFVSAAAGNSGPVELASGATDVGPVGAGLSSAETGDEIVCSVAEGLVAAVASVGG